MRIYLGSLDVHEIDERNKPQIPFYLRFYLLEPMLKHPPHGHEIQKAMILANVDENVGLLQSILQSLQYRSRLRIRLEIRHVEWFQEMANELQVIRQFSTILLLDSCFRSGLHDDDDEADSIKSRELRDIGNLSCDR